MTFPPEQPEVIERAFWDLACLVSERPKPPTEKDRALWETKTLNAWYNGYADWDKKVTALSSRLRGLMV